MNNRRLFFRTFIGHAGMLMDEFRGVELIPLNRLKELPEHIVEQIEPEFFPEEKWSVRNKTLFIPKYKQRKELRIELNDIELQVLEYFKQHIKLKEIALKISNDPAITFDEIYQTVTSLFFRLASLRICHPKEIYRIDEIVKAQK
jgi:hypothetical protein